MLLDNVCYRPWRRIKLSQGNNNPYYIVIALSIVIVLMSATAFVKTQNAPVSDEMNTIQMTGSSEKMLTPDTATLNIGTVVKAASSEKAAAQNAVIMETVMKELKALGLEEKELQTSYVSVYPDYNYEGGKSSIVGYSASNSVQVTTKKMKILSDIIDRSAAVGANQIGGISFMVSSAKQKEAREELIKDAVSDAKTKADILANSLGVKIKGVKTSSIMESSRNDIYYKGPMYEMATDSVKGPSTPIEPGESKVVMSVQVTYIIA